MSFRSAMIFGLLACLSAGSLFAQDDSAKKKAAADRRKSKAARNQRLTSKKGAKTKTDTVRRTALSKEQQNAAMAFARENHSELVPLINSLKKQRPADYNRALRELHGATTRFGRLKERLPGDRYEQQLMLWKLDSHIKLQLAKWSVSSNENLESDIRRSLAERKEVRRQQYEQELLKAKERITKLESALNKLNSRSTDAEFEQLTKSVKRRKRPLRKQASRKQKAEAKASEKKKSK